MPENDQKLHSIQPQKMDKLVSGSASQCQSQQRQTSQRQDNYYAVISLLLGF
jgi:hypothetical protein